MFFIVNINKVKIMFKKFFKFIVVSPFYGLNFLIDILSLLNPQFKKIALDHQLHHSDSEIKKVKHVSCENKEIQLQFYTPNSLNIFRAESFSDKEPETLAWIEEFGKGESVLFDIGAHVGLYSIYHNKVNNSKCYAFEPSFFNLKLLLKNLNLNNCQDMTNIVSNPLFSTVGFNEFKYGSDVEGGALSAFGVDFGHDGKDINSQVGSNVLGFSLDWMLDNAIIEIPNLIKIDVDGIEHIILQGAKKVLTHSECKSILVEVNDDFSEQSKEVDELLTGYGYILRGKLHGESFNKPGKFSASYNQIWVKDNNQI